MLRSLKRLFFEKLFLPVLFLMAVAFFSRQNIGLRHILLVYPLLFIFSGAVVKALERKDKSKPEYGLGKIIFIIIFIIVLGWYAYENFSIWPDYLAYFNQIAGGPDNGYKYLADSNLDWGQDLKRLKAYLDRQGIGRVKLAYFGTAHPENYGLYYKLLPCSYRSYISRFNWSNYVSCEDIPAKGIIAISVTELLGVYADNHNRYLYLRKLKPKKIIGHSIYVYEVR